MFLIPPHSQLMPQEYSYTEKFNLDTNITQDACLRLSSKLGNNDLQFIKHPKDGKIYNKIECNNFYKDFKKDAYTQDSYTQDSYTKDSYKSYLVNNIINTQPQKEIKTPMPSNKNSHYDNNTITSTHNIQQEINPYLHINTNTLSIYNNAERYKEFINKSFNNTHAIPLHTSGINNINILYDDKYNNNTFNYKRFALQNTQNSNQIDETQNNNLLYKNDITQETQKLQKKYINDITQRNIDLYSSVFEDMHILGFQINN